MTETEINIAIAEACGARWFFNPEKPCGYLLLLDKRYCDWEPAELPLIPEVLKRAEIPDYCHDLNAMHEAESTLTENDSRRYAHGFLPQIFEPALIVNAGAYRKAIFATARQRAEAFLRTIGKWKEAA